MKSDHNISSIFARILEVESLRSSLSLILSIAVVLVVVKIPWQSNSAGANWQVVNRVDRINFVPQPEEIVEPEEIKGGIVSAFEEAPPEEEENIEEVAEGKNEVSSEDKPEPIPDLAKLERLDTSPVLEFVDQSPTIIGGLSSLYLNIDYPLAARDKGIQGLTVLMFIVEKDGSTSGIEVIKSLHPACDSAAVAAVSRTMFKPGVQDGKEVRVKMRLPIRFKLVKRNQRYNSPGDSLSNPS